jgi:hypothetical protein
MHRKGYTMKVLFLILAFHFFLFSMMCVKMGSFDTRHGLRQSAEIMVRNSNLR